MSKGSVAVVIPGRASESGLTAVFQQLFPLFPREALETMKQSGIFALSAPGNLEDALASAGLRTYEDEEVETPIVFDSVNTATRAFVGAGPTQVAIERSGEDAVMQVAQEALKPFAGSTGQVRLPGWYRVVLARS